MFINYFTMTSMKSEGHSEVSDEVGELNGLLVVQPGVKRSIPV